jgi:predicted Holliday junction resolvase-like endonuclease
MIPIDYGSIFETLKKKGLLPMMLGLILMFQYRYIERQAEQFEEKQKELKMQQDKMEIMWKAQIESLERRLMNCETQRNEDMIRRFEQFRKDNE